MVTELSGNVCLSDCDKCSAVPHDEVEKCRQRNLIKLCRQEIKELGDRVLVLEAKLSERTGDDSEIAGQMKMLEAKVDGLKTPEEIYADRAAKEPHRTANGEIGKAMREGLKGKKGK